MNNFFKKNIWLYYAKSIGLSGKVISIIILFSLMSTIVELFGVGMFLPIFQFIQLDGDIDALVADSIIWQYLINIFIYFDFNPSLLVLLSTSFVFFIGRQLFIYARVVYTKAVVERLSQKQRNKLFGQYLDADTSYQDSTPVGNLTNIIMVEVSNAIGAVMGPIGLMVFTIMLIGYLCLLFILSWEMTIASVVIFSIAGIISKIWIKKSTKIGRNLVDANTTMSEFLVGRLQSPRLVRLSCTEDIEKKEFLKLTLSQRKHRVFITILQAKTTAVLEPVVIGLSLSFLYFAYTVFQLQIEVIGLYLVIILRLMPILKSIIVQIQAMQSSVGSIEILENRFNLLEKYKEKNTGNVKIEALRQSVVFNNVSYCYIGGLDDALKDITVDFRLNEITAIVGPSGSGKSTLIDLLPRLRSPTKGVIRFNGEDYRNYTLESIRDKISYTPQYPQIFNGTAKEHILYGKKNATNNEIEEAIYLSGVRDFINQMPQGIDTILGEGAIKLSGGQRQRLDLARAIVKSAPILMLDEPTSSLDAESEKLFKQAIYRILNNTDTTIIIVTHRLASIMDVDKIIVLNKGKVEATGTHLELIAQDGWYAKTCKIQMSKE